jgi:hypothetical protein
MAPPFVVDRRRPLGWTESPVWSGDWENVTKSFPPENPGDSTKGID